MVILNANPLENIRNSNTVEFVLKNGRVYQGNTLNEVWPSQKEAPVYNWQNSKPEGLPGINE